MTPAVSVVIPSKNGALRLVETLAALANQACQAPFEVIVVDDGSDDGTAEVASRTELRDGSVRVVRHPASKGRGAARNSGVDVALGAVVLFLDDDMTARPGVVEAHRVFHQTTDAAARGNVTLADPGQDSCFARFLRREEAFELQQLLANAGDLPFGLSQSGHLSVRRSAFVDAGGFDTSITQYGFEDIDLGYRLRQRGVRLAFLPAAHSVHRAFMTDLTRYLDRHWEAGRAAKQWVERNPGGEFREYLRLDPPASLGALRVPAGLAALRLTNRMLLRPSIRRIAGSPAGFGALRGLLRAGEALAFDRLVHFGYHVARDVRYFQGYFGERKPR